MSQMNLTTMEVAALTDPDGGLNMTDGHARFPVSAEQAAVVEQLPAMFREAGERAFGAIELDAHTAFFSAIGQASAPIGTDRILSCYLSTLATDIVARALPAGSSIAILHPTFDNIADLFATRGLRLFPMYEEDLISMTWPAAHIETVIVTHPNNPTGLVTDPERLRSLADHCAHHNQTLIIDAAFRGQVKAAQYDCYEILNDSGVSWIVIEDTGKLWPMHEMKIGFLVWSERCDLPLEKAFSESLLSASPVILRLVTALADDWVNGGFERTRELVERNRGIVKSHIGAVGLSLADPESEISVARISFPIGGPDSEVLYQRLVLQGIHVLPCPPFHWANPEEGLRFIRLSLARPSGVVERAAEGLAKAYESLLVPH